MKKTLLVSAVALSTLMSINAKADIIIDNMIFFGDTENYAVSGSLLDTGGGFLQSIDPFLGTSWTATQETLFMDNTGSWSGVSLSGGVAPTGAFDYDATIASMAADQVAVGLYFNWNGNTEIAILEIFDCVASSCNGNGVPMMNGPFTGQTFVFSGTGSATVVPVPTAAWLFGSGLLGLVGMARRKT